MPHRLCRQIMLACAALFAAAAAPAPYPFAAGSKADEAAIRAIVADNAAESTDGHEAANLDWENAFGIRYKELAKRDAFYKSVVKPLQTHTDQSSLEVKVEFITPSVAVADEYWHVVGQLDVETRETGPDRWGRSTDIFVKKGGTWTKVVERITDLRLPYYKHLDEAPLPVALPAGTLPLYAGTYEVAPGKVMATVRATGDRLTIDAGHFGTLSAVPRSATEFTAFRPDDLAEYYTITFLPGPGGTMQLKFGSPWEGAHQLTLSRRK